MLGYKVITKGVSNLVCSCVWEMPSGRTKKFL